MNLKHKLGKAKLFIVLGIIVIKLFLMGMFSSDYQDKMFIPFVTAFLNGNNPYDFYFENSLPSSFPYFPYMLLIESVGGLLVRVLSPTMVFWQNLIFKIPLLLFDLIGYIVLLKMNVSYKYATVFYFCSPIILFGTYIHGQLDIIPTVLLLAAVMFLLNWKNRNNMLLYSVFLGFAIGCKFHIMAAVPVLFIYVAKKRGLISSIKYHLFSAIIVIISCIYFWGNGFINTVLFNKEQSALTAVSIDFGHVSLAIPIVVLMIVYLNVYGLNYFNKNLLISMLGMLFTVFLICLSPMPAWYIWAVPFYVLFFCYIAEEKYKLMFIYAVFNLFYLVYFVFFHITEYTDVILLGRSLQFLKIQNPTLRTIIFAIMVACLFVVVMKIYKFGIASNNLYRRKGNSFVIGIAGDSGSGKSKLLEKIEHLFGTEKDILFIEGDGDHRWSRNDENWEQYTALNPQANYLYRQAENIRSLKRGNHVLRSEYDHNTGRFTEQRRVDAKKYIVLCGLHSLYLPFLRDEMDLKIYMDTEKELRNFWKIQRDIEKRGYSKEKIVSQIEKRIPDAKKYIYPQKEYADLIISYFDKTLNSCYEDNHSLELSVKFELSIDHNIEDLIKSFNEFGVFPQHSICDDFYHQVIVFDAKEINKDIDFGKIAEINVPQYEDFFSYYPSWGQGVDGVIQVMILFMMSEIMKGQK